MERTAKVSRTDDGWRVELDTGTGRQRYECATEEQAQALVALFSKPLRPPVQGRQVTPRASGLVARMSRALGRDSGSR